MDLSEEIAEQERMKEERFQLQKRALKRQNDARWKKNNHNLFPTKEALKPSDRHKNNIDFE